MAELTIDELREIMRSAAGEDEGVDLDGDILDLACEDLGYDSLALMQISTKIKNELGVPLEDDAIEPQHTPRHILHTVNDLLPSGV